MTLLLDPGLPPEHPRAMYHDNLLNIDSVTWYSETASLREIIRFVLGLFRLDFRDDLLFDDLGSARAKDDSIALTALVGPRGSVLTLWVFSDALAAIMNDALDAEASTALSEWKQGEYRRSAMRATMLQRGQPIDHWLFGGTKVFDFINDAEVVSVFDAEVLGVGTIITDELENDNG